MRATRLVPLAIALSLTGCLQPAAPAPTAPTATTKAATGAKSRTATAYKLYANSRIEAAMAIATDGDEPSVIVYATEAQVVNAMETANLAAVQAAEAEARAEDALTRARAAQAQAADVVAKANAAGDAATLAAAQADAAAKAADVAKAQAVLAEASAKTAAAQAALSDSKADAALTQAALGLAKAQQAVDAAAAAGNAAAAASAAAGLASAEAKLVDAKAQAAASAAALADAKAAAASAQAAAAATQASSAQTTATAAQTQAANAQSSASSAQTNAANAAAQAQAAASAAAAAQAAAEAAAARTATPAATVSTFIGLTAGLADGAAALARLNDPNGLDLDAAGNLYVADAGNHAIRKVAPDGTTSTLAGGAGVFDAPYGVAVAADGTVFVADTGNHRIRAIAPGGAVTTLAGTGTAGFADGDAATAQFHTPFSLALLADGDLVVADAGNRRLRRVTRAGVVTTIAGGAAGHVNGPLAGARFMVPNDVAVAPDGKLYVADGIAHDIRVVDLAAGVVSTLAGSTTAGIADGRGFSARFNAPSGLAVAPNGDVLVADSLNHAIRRVTPDGVVTLVAGGNPGFADGAGTTARLDRPTDVVVTATGDILVSDTNNHRIRKITK